MKREKRLTKKERKAADFASGARRPAAGGAQAADNHHHHIHCVACGKHLDPDMFAEPKSAEFIRCQHGSDFAACIGCHDKAKELIDEHDRTNTPVKSAAAWH